MFLFKNQTRLTVALLLCAIFAVLTVAAPVAASPSTPVTQSGPAEALAGPTPVPTVVGPLPVSVNSYPFGAADHEMVPEDLSKVGYLEEEYLVSGRPTSIRGPRPVRPLSGRRTPRTPPACSSGGRLTARDSAATSSSRY